MTSEVPCALLAYLLLSARINPDLEVGVRFRNHRRTPEDLVRDAMSQSSCTWTSGAKDALTLPAKVVRSSAGSMLLTSGVQ